jgi:hypothetical protein
MARLPEIHVDLTVLNHSELVLLAKWSGLPASRGLPREVLIESLETFTPSELPIPFDEKRRQLQEWLERWWNNIRMQMPKKVCPDCSLCKDLQVLDCYSENERQIKPPTSRR